MQVFLHRLPCPRNRALILSILLILAILLQTIAIKVLTDLFSVLLRRSIDIKVFQTFFFLILKILSILAILLQTDTSGTARDRPSPSVSTEDNWGKLTPSRPVYAKTIPSPTSLATARK